MDHGQNLKGLSAPGKARKGLPFVPKLPVGKYSVARRSFAVFQDFGQAVFES
jgi:hypothetical protein